MSRSVLVTGATGALGQAVLRRLHGNSRDIIVFSPGRDICEDSLDLNKPDQIVKAIERTRPDLIFNLAATFSPVFEEAYAVNVAATRYILNAVADLGLFTRVVLIGSAAEYGAVSLEDNPITEDQVLRPMSIYGVTKSWQTHLAYLYASLGVNVVVARVFNLIGPGLSERLFVGRLHKQLDELRRGVRVKIELGSLLSVRDYVTIENAVTQLLAIADHGESGMVYHIASGQPVTMRDVLISELAVHGLSESIVIEDATMTSRLGYDVPLIYADISRTNALLKNQVTHAEP